MKAKIIRIGNSQGVRIPKPLLEESGLSDEVDLAVEGDCLVLRSWVEPRPLPPSFVAHAFEVGPARALPGLVAEPAAALRRDDEGRTLSRLLDRALAGEEVVVTRSGRPVAKLVPLPRSPRRPGRLAGQLTVADDFDAPLPESLLAGFRGEAD